MTELGREKAEKRDVTTVPSQALYLMNSEFIIENADAMARRLTQELGLRGPQLVELQQINGREPDEYTNLPYFEELTAINPDKKLTQYYRQLPSIFCYRVKSELFK